MRLVPHDRDRTAGILRAQPPEERGKLAVGREILQRDHVPAVVDLGKDLRRLDGADERARRKDIDRRRAAGGVCAHRKGRLSAGQLPAARSRRAASSCAHHP
ncbi:MAG: hypothetical protein ACREXS_21130 [Gammaproteobacteria bacterium]